VIHRDQVVPSSCSEPRAVFWDFLFPKAWHDRMVRIPLPPAPPPGSGGDDGGPIIGWRNPIKNEAYEARAEAIAALFARLDGALTGDGSGGAKT
jgi:hypothetical protein